ncbi:Kin of IRRE-like protein 3 [Madurella mycetomatis]|uniref:Kin of IRRE-like protein 3 n=1 Tax=Madurella mycetomatis TaxID=100816 RepID=A0A175W7V2_9PEZI|nr:Kin of IRRE-like protein 3 [Madurella mycetomatis]KXX79589.1 Kin of IRRE-like protein 3 [Madurella mycetomatis]
MRISAGRCWLVAAALSLGTANGDFVTFSNFEGPAIFASGPSQTFTWSASGVTVNEINLRRDNGTELGELIARVSRSTENDPDTPAVEPIATPTASPGFDTPRDPMPTGTDSGTIIPTGEVVNTSGTSAANSGGGLPMGAVIGIAVGCGVAGLAVVFALVWFLVRRHQKKKSLLPVGSYASGNRAEDLIAEKEASADVDASPHSPYSDDGTAGAAAPYPEGPGATVAAGALHRQHPQDQSRSFTPYSDRPSGAGAGAGSPSTRAASVAQTDEARISIPSPTPGRATPRALTTPYAHLVEEGMTEEEIRRLEDEERQLDAAIEQAGRR